MRNLSPYVIAWLHHYVAQQPAYLDYLTGKADPSIPAALAEFASYRNATAGE